MKDFGRSDALLLVALAMLAAGLAGYDWRWAAIVVGVVLLAVALISAGRGD